MARVRYMQHAGGSYSAVVVLGTMSVVAAEHSSFMVVVFRDDCR